jgi:predicted MPP superfamily phosphohydrolase
MRYFSPAFLSSLLKAGYLFMPFELYAFLGFIFFDLISVVQRAAKILSVSHKYYSTVDKIVKASILGGILVLVIVGNINFNNTKISKYSITASKKDSKLEHLKIVMTADIHLAEITSMDFMQNFVNQMNALEADIILLPGDLFESDRQNPLMDSIMTQMKQLKSKYGTFGIPGNHEFYGNYQKKLEFCRMSGIQMILDSALVIDNAFVLAGRNDRHDKHRKSLDRILYGTPQNLPLLLMDHRPDEFESALINHVDIQFSGHTHNGQLFPNNYIIDLIYDLGWGHQKIKNTNFFVTCGVQGWGPQVRTTGYSEIMLIEVEFIK